jgi:hypothetical protein
MGGVGQAIRVFGGEKALEATLTALNAAVFAATPSGADRGASPDDYRGDATLP